MTHYRLQRGCWIWLTAMIAVTSMLHTGSAVAAEPTPGTACSPTGAFSIAGGPEAAGKAYMMVCASGTWTRIVETSATGFVGIMRATPTAPLDVGGEMRLGNSGSTCTAALAGTEHYNASAKAIEFCNGSAWTAYPQVCTSVTPAMFNFTDQTGVNPSTLITSNIIQITGMGCAVNIAASGSGTPTYRVCSDSSCATVLQDWTSDGSLVSSGQYVQMRLTSSATGSGTVPGILAIATVATVWRVTTKGSTGCSSDAPGTVCSDGSVYAGITPDGYVPFYIQRCNAGMYWNGGACAGMGFNFAWSLGASILNNITNTTTGKANTASIAALNNSDGPYSAALYCKNLNEDGHTDWYLPSANDLRVITNNYSTNFNATAYLWTSTENATASAQAFAPATAAYNLFNGKTQATSTRCVRHD